MADQSNLEHEMSRFEQEILGTGPSQTPPAAVIGASTFTSVQEQLTALRAQVYGAQNNASTNLPPSAPAASGAPQRHISLTAPPRPPGFRPPFNGNLETPNGTKPLAGPPPPPPSLTGTSFVPSQLRVRPPAPPPGVNNRPQMRGPPENDQNSSMQRPHMRGPPMQGPPMQGPPTQRPHMQGPHMQGPHMQGPHMQGPHMQGPHMQGSHMQRPHMQRPMMPPMRPPPGMMPGMPHGMGPVGNQGTQYNSVSGNPVRYTQPAVVEATKVVYSSKPVIHKPGKTDTKTKTPDIKDQASNKREAADPVVSSSSTSQAAAAAMPSTSNVSVSEGMAQPAAKKEKKSKIKDKRCIRTAANEVWEDHSLADWDPNDFRVFCGDLGNEVTDEKLAEAFKKYPSLQRTKVIRDRRTHKTKGYGFISFKDPTDYTRAMREMNGKYVGNRPIKLRKSNWRDRNVDVVKKKEREKKKLGFR